MAFVAQIYRREIHQYKYLPLGKDVSLHCNIVGLWAATEAIQGSAWVPEK